MKKVIIIIMMILGLLMSGCGYDTMVDNSDVINTLNNQTVNTNLFGVPDTFTKSTSKEQPYNVLQSGVNNLRIRPDVINEHMESSRNVQSIVTPTNMVTQSFRASQDNINSIYLTMESADLNLIDNFNSYLTDASLQSVWVASGNLAIRDNTVYPTQSMSLPLDTNGDSWTNTIPSTDYTGYSFHLDGYFTKDYDKVKVSFFIGDGVNTKSFDLVYNQKNNVIHFNIPENVMINDGAVAPVMTAITQVGFIVTKKDGGEFMFVDELYAVPPAGSIGIELWDMGVNPPVNGVTSINDGTQYTQIGDISFHTPVATFIQDLSVGKVLYHIHDFACGVALEIPGNIPLIKDNYYMLVLKYIDTPVSIYGSNPGYNYDYYKHGFASNTPDYTTPITQIGQYNDVMFSIFSTQDTYITNMIASADAVPGNNAQYMSSIENINMTTIEVINSHGLFLQDSGKFDFTNRPMHTPKGSKFNLDYISDYNDAVTKVVFGATYLFEPPKVWG